jgi:hypothetical protein
MATRLIDDAFEALDEQTVVVPGTGTLDIVIPTVSACLDSPSWATCSTSDLLTKAHKSPTSGTARFGTWARPCRSRA